MYRTALLTAFTVILASSRIFAQFGGMGGMGGGMGGAGGPMPSGVVMQGNRFAGAGTAGLQRSAQVDLEGGESMGGIIELRPLIVDSDLGKYVITPEKIKLVRFLKPVDDVKPVDELDENRPPVPQAPGGGNVGEVAAPAARQNRLAVLRTRRGVVGGVEMVADPGSQTGMATLVARESNHHVKQRDHRDDSHSG